jgi:hypothetical protein
VLGERQRTNALAGGGKNSVAHRRENRRKRGFSKTGGWIVGLEEMDFDFGRHLVYAYRGIIIEIVLDGPAAVNGDFIRHDGT